MCPKQAACTRELPKPTWRSLFPDILSNPGKFGAYTELKHCRDWCNKGCLTALIFFCLCAAEMKSEFNILRENYREKVDFSLWKALASQNVMHWEPCNDTKKCEDYDVNHKAFHSAIHFKREESDINPVEFIICCQPTFLFMKYRYHCYR